MKRLSVVVMLIVANAAAGQSIVEMRNAAAAALEAKDYRQCASIYGLLARAKQDAETMRAVVSCLALSQDVDAAFLALADLADFLWTDRHDLEADPDLAVLRADPRWSASMARIDANWPAVFGDSNRQLSELARADQADRQPPVDWNVVSARDRERRIAVDAILARGEARTSWDFCNAALVMQHGSEPADYLKAYQLAMCSAEVAQTYRGCKGLGAAAYDRYLQSIGKPQIYGTQVRRINGVWTLDPIDETAVTDEERAKFNLPPLAEFKRRVAEANQRK